MKGYRHDKEYIKLFEDTLSILNLPNRRAGIAVGEFKGYTLTKLAAYAATFDGAMAEVGTWIGGSARLIAKTVPFKQFYCFDTFEGIPKIDESIESEKWLTEFRNDNVDVYGLAQKVTADCENVILQQGIFPESLINGRLDFLVDRPFCFVHADADVYPSTKNICEFFYPRLIPGGVIVFDDYGYSGAPGAKKAVDEYFEDKPDKHTVIPGGQAIVIKSTR